jgi:hypothetical protein
LNSPVSPALVELIPELLDRMISLGQLASEIKRALHSNGHMAKKLEEIRGYLKRQAYR